MELDVVKVILSKKEDFLRRHLVLSTSVIEKLRQYDVIGKYTQDQMTINAGNSDKQLTHLFVCLRTRGLLAFNGFLKVLRLTFHGWLADDLLDTTIESGHVPATSYGSVVPVRDVINRMHQSKIENYPSRDESVQKTNVHTRTEVSQQKTFEKYHVKPDEEETLRRYDDDGRVSPITKIPKNLRDLERVFESESSSTRSSLASLRQEEIHIRALLQQNIREQQELLTKQDALIEIKDKMKEISKSATQLFRPEPESRLPRTKQKEIQRTNWKLKK